MNTLKDRKDTADSKDQHTDAVPGNEDGLVEMGRVSETKGGVWDRSRMPVPVGNGLELLRLTRCAAPRRCAPPLRHQLLRANRLITRPRGCTFIES